MEDAGPILQFRNLWVRKKKNLDAPVETEDKEKDSFLLKGLSGDFPAGRHSGILSSPGPPKDALLRILCGISPPDHGEIRRIGAFSWPLGWSFGFHTALSGVENINFVSRVYGVDSRYALDFVAAFTELGARLKKPFQHLPKNIRDMIVLSLALAIPFDFYVGEGDLSGGDPKHKERFEELVAARMRTSTFIIIARHPRSLARFRQAPLLFKDGNLWTFPTYEAMNAHFTRGRKA